MKVLSIRQPWAWLIIQGYKDIENRTWHTSYRGELYIHASKKIDQEIIEILKEEGVKIPDFFETGGIIGKVNLVDCVTESDSEWFEGPFGFKLDNPQPLPFSPLKGKLGLFEI